MHMKGNGEGNRKREWTDTRDGDLLGNVPQIPRQVSVIPTQCDSQRDQCIKIPREVSVVPIAMVDVNIASSLYQHFRKLFILGKF